MGAMFLTGTSAFKFFAAIESSHYPRREMKLLFLLFKKWNYLQW